MAEKSDSPKVKIHIIGKTPTVWTMADMDILHKHRVVGVMDGAVFETEEESERGFPMAILHEAVLVLEEKGIVDLVTYPDFEKEPSDVMKAMMDYLEKKDMQTQIDSFFKERKACILSNLDKIVKSAKLKNQKLSQSDPAYVTEDKLTNAHLLQEKLSKISHPKEGTLLVQTHISYPFLSDLPSEKATLDFPEDEEDRRRLAVFRKLYERGYWIVDGRDEGLDFFLYKGDPNIVHAVAGVTIQHSNIDANPGNENAGAAWCDLVSFNRLMTYLKRPLIVAYVRDTLEVDFQTMRYCKNPFAK